MSLSWLQIRASVPAPISVPPSQIFEGNDGPWSTFPIQIGTDPQTVNILISTASSQTWAINPQGCTPSDPPDCSSSRGGVFQTSNSSTWSQNQDAANGLYPLTLGPTLNVSGTGLYGYDTVTLGEDGNTGLTLDRQVVASIATKSFYLGLFGLSGNSSTLTGTTNKIPSFVSKLNDTNVIPSLSWSYTAGNQYRPGPVYGSLILGGYDDSRFVRNDIPFSMNISDIRNFGVKIGGMSLITDDTTTVLGTENETISAFVDSTSPYIILPANVCEQFELAFGLEWNETVQAYLVNDTLHDALQGSNTSVIFNIGNEDTVVGQGFDITLPYSAFNLTAGPPLLNNPGRYFPLRRSSNDSQVTLGRTFLQEAYLIANYEHNNFSLSQCNWDSNAKSHIVPIRRPGESSEPISTGVPNDDTHHTSHKLSAGAIAGIVIGVVVGLILIACLGFILWRKFRPKKPQEPEHNEKPPFEMDNGERDPYSTIASPIDIGKDHPQSPELGTTPHKGHELHGSVYFDQTPITGTQPVELAATERQSHTLSSPISVMSALSSPNSPPRLHTRQPSDPVSVMRERSDASRLHSRQPSDPVSVTRERSDASRLLHKREMSDPVSIMSERRDETGGTPEGGG